MEPLILIAIVAGYVALLLVIALWVECRVRAGRPNPAGNALVYSLSFAVYCTTWTFYGSVGYATRGGLGYLGVYIGPTLIFILGWVLLAS